MTSETNLQTSRRLLEECINEGNLDLMDELCATDFVTHDPAEPEDVVGIEAHKLRIARYREAMPDMRFEIEDQVASRDRVVTRWTVTGTNTGKLQEMKPTGRPVEIDGMTIDRFDSVGRIDESWDYWDNLGLMRQLGMIPEEVIEGFGGEILR